MFTILVRESNGAARQHPLRQGETRIGRNVRDGLSLDDPRVSRCHAVLQCAGDSVVVTDLESRNGTYLNGRRLERDPAPLRAGDALRIGDFTLVFDTDGGLRGDGSSGGEMRAVLQKAPEELLTSGSTPASPGVSREMSVEGLRFELEKKTRVLGLFYELSRTLGSVFSLDDVYDKVMGILLQVTPAARIVIYQASGREGVRQVAARTRGAATTLQANAPIQVSRTVLDNVAKQRVSVLLESTNLDAEALPDSMRLNQAHSVMAAPILGRTGLAGLIYTDQQIVGQAFSSDDLDLLNAVAVQTGIAIDTVRAYDALQREALAREKYERFLPQQLVDDVLLNPGKEIIPGGVRQTITVLFADLRGFTSLSEGNSPEAVVDLLNRVLTLMSEIVFRHGGTLDKYIGDGVMALFGAPYRTERDAVKAVRAAIDMQRALVAFNQGLAANGQPAIGVGIGINTGPAIVGFIGSDSRLEYTAIGDTVNTASRLEHLAAAGQIIIGEHTMQALDAGVAYTLLDAVQVKGRAAKLQIAEVVWAKR